MDLLTLLQNMALNGHGIAWHDAHGEYRPFSVEADVIEWWHDPEECGSTDFETAIRATIQKCPGIWEA